jgi:transcriptional regulator with XRE-family HTH domain
MDAKEISAALVRARIYKGWSQMVVAGKLGRSRTAVSRAEQAHTNLTVKLLLTYLDLLGLELIIQPKKIKAPDSEM